MENNPILDYTKHLIFGYYGELKVVYNQSGKEELYTHFGALENDYRSGKLWPNDLKPAVAAALNKFLQPIRDHFSDGEPKKLLELVKKYKVTK